MPYRVFSLEEVAAYLHLSRADVEELVKKGEIPFEVRGGRPLFRRREVDEWASQRILGLEGRGLAEYHQKSTLGTRALFPSEAMMPEMIEPGYIQASLRAKTKASILRDMVELAEKTGRVYNPKDLLANLQAREDLCSTGLPGGLALLHPRHHQPYMFESSFLVLGRTLQEIPFGAPDGQASDLFFLICCQDDRIHLHTLARICLMAEKTSLLAQLRAAADPAGMHEAIVVAEQQVIAGKSARA